MIDKNGKEHKDKDSVTIKINKLSDGELSYIMEHCSIQDYALIQDFLNNHIKTRDYDLEIEQYIMKN